MKYSNIEFWIATSLLAIALFQYLDYPSSAWADHFSRPFRERGLAYDYYINYLFPELSRPVVLYAGFLFLNFYVLPRQFDTKKYNNTVLYTILTCLFLLIGFSYADLLQRAYSNDFLYFVRRNIPIVLMLLGIFFLYTLIKKNLESYLLDPKKHASLLSRILKEILIATAIWGVILFLLLIDRSTRHIAAFWISIIPFAFFFFQLNIYWLLPQAERNKSSSGNLILKVLFFSILLFVPFGILFITIVKAVHFSLFLFIWICSLIAIVPLSRYVYQENKEHFLELHALKKALKTSTSNLQFLRSQINPHFLFNALNTLYGTALQEKSERTAQGIQKLGDMMRFMLHENNQDKILLAREIDYIRNYIDLQLLRTQTSPDILIETEIADTLNSQYIAPMILIPFIENAFKHGISLTHKSWIKITLHTDAEKLYFDVHNSIHRHTASDPEKDKSGIGLENVKQRLELIYPGKYDLVIRETPQEFFIHLTLDL